MEEWKRFNEFLEVSSCGRVRSHGKIILGARDKHGYVVINSRYKGKNYRFLVHRMVAALFIPNPNNFKIVNHLDFDTANNEVSNLEWCTQKQNVQHFWTFGSHGSRRGENNPRSKFTNEQAEEIRREYKRTSYKVSNVRELAKKYGVNKSAIYRIIQNKTYKKE